MAVLVPPAPHTLCQRIGAQLANDFCRALPRGHSGGEGRVGKSCAPRGTAHAAGVSGHHRPVLGVQVHVPVDGVVGPEVDPRLQLCVHDMDKGLAFCGRHVHVPAAFLRLVASHMDMDPLPTANAALQAGVARFTQELLGDMALVQEHGGNSSHGGFLAPRGTAKGRCFLGGAACYWIYMLAKHLPLLWGRACAGRLTLLWGRACTGRLTLLPAVPWSQGGCCTRAVQFGWRRGFMGGVGQWGAALLPSSQGCLVALPPSSQGCLGHGGPA